MTLDHVFTQVRFLLSELPTATRKGYVSECRHRLLSRLDRREGSGESGRGTLRRDPSRCSTATYPAMRSGHPYDSTLYLVHRVMGRHCRHLPTATRIYPFAGGFEGPDFTGWYVKGVCEYGTCVELNCPVCGCNLGGWGPIDCPCEDMIGYHAMRQKAHVPIKPSVAGRRPSRRRH